MYFFYSILILILILISGPLIILFSGEIDTKTHWSIAKRDPLNEAPNPKIFKKALVRVYYARTFGWRGAFACHSWISLKDKNGENYEVFQVMGWRLYQKMSSVDHHVGEPDRYFYGQKPILAGELSGSEAEDAILKIREASKNYPYHKTYSIWPGPNSYKSTRFTYSYWHR